MRKNSFQRWTQPVQVILGLFLAAFAYRAFLIPNEIVPGGITGVAQLIQRLTGLPVGMTAIVLNIPLFMLSIRRMGWSFGAYSLAATLAFSLMLDYLPISTAASDNTLAAVFGGALSGIGFGLILRGGATTGGTDMLARVIHHRFPVVRTGVVLFAVDALVVATASLVFEPVSAMYSLIALYISTNALDMVLEGFDTARAYHIISNKPDVIAARIMAELERGVTALSGRGMYSGQDKQVLLCVASRMESVRLRRIVAQEVPSAFVIASNVSEVLGEGFTQHEVPNQPH